ncbi:MAG: family 43 glycosylhydrolase [Pseudoxanthomonas sp.]|nr:family 43 glycosylhydrolase [Pseudoxanthomonas sp.]
MTTRRDLFKAVAASAVAMPLTALAAGASRDAGTPTPAPGPRWARGIEGQRKADLGDGTYLNPILAGDHPDPTILKDGDDYYMTFSSFLAYPGLVVWHSKDLVNWTPIGPALQQNLGDIWAVDLCRHEGRYFIYLPANPTGRGWSIYAIWADDVRGPWSAPVDLKISGCIDPGHVVGEDGRRYLFVNGIRKIRLRDDGLATDGELEHAYKPWRYPEHWITENFAPEGPKLRWHDGWLYLVTAVGGTAGPATGHMVIAARSRSVHGPWEHCPHNPLVRTQSTHEPWWSRGHATVVEGPGGDWWMVYHGYENGFRTLGRQTLLEPMEWTADGWFRAKGGDLSQPLPKPRGTAPGPNGHALSGPLARERFGVQWCFHQPGPDEMQRLRWDGDTLVLAAAGTSPADSSPLACIVGDRAYQAEVTLELEPGAEGGLLLYYNPKAFVGLGFTSDTVKTYEYSEELPWARQPRATKDVRVRMTNDANVITWEYSHDGGRSWTVHGTRMEVSGMHHNVFGGFLSLKVGLYATGIGAVRLRDFAYRAIPETAGA